MEHVYKEKSSEQFINALCTEIRKGYGVTPFTGSGISSRSGIIMGIEFAEYLTYTVFRSVVEESAQERLFGDRRRSLWSVRHDGWPESPKPYEVDAVRTWVVDKYKALCRACGLEVNMVDEDGGRTVKSLVTDLTREDGPALLDAQIRRPLLPSVLRGPKTTVNDRAVKDFLRAVGAEDAARGEMYRTGISADSREGLEERATRSLHDWRATLHFLAELDAVKDGQGRRPFLGHHDSGIIDSFNAHITRGRKPNLTHSKLAHLAGPMRTRTILTTNFDSLQEDAFSQLGEPVTVIPVGSHSYLPSPNTVHAQNSLVKLHGSLTDTRADYSLDEMPSVLEKTRFFHYVIGGHPPKSASNPLIKEPIEREPSFLPTHLLVLGYGGGDSRILQNMKFVLDHCPQALIFWVCFSNGDLETIQKLFSESDYANPPRLIVTVTDRADLLLLNLHQKLTYGLARGGFSYQFSHDVPPKLWKQVEHDALQKRDDKPGPGEGGKGGEAIANMVRKLSQSISDEMAHERREERPQHPPENDGLKKPKKSKPSTDDERVKRRWHNGNQILFVDNESGIMAVLRDAFEISKRRDRFSCVWLEMEDYTCAEELAHSLLQIIALRRGLFQLEHAVLMPSRFQDFRMEDDDHNYEEMGPNGSHAWRERFFRMARYFGIQKERWVIFLYGRNVPGICAGWDGSPWSWKQYVEFHRFLDGLAANGFLVVYAPYSRRRLREDRKKANKTRQRETKLGSRLVPENDRPKLRPPIRWNPDTVKDAWIDTVLEDIVKDPNLATIRYVEVAVDPIPSTTHYTETLLPYFADEILGALYPPEKPDGTEVWPEKDAILRAHFLYACSLFRRSRPLSAFLSEGVFPAPDAFGMEGLDNDWARHEQSNDWVRSFRDKGFFWRKPGGNVWLYRDARLGMQALLQKAKNVPVGSRGGEGGLKLAAAYQLRARMHFWIAAWYARAFFTTSHSVPIIEAFHHLYKSITLAPIAGCATRLRKGEGAAGRPAKAPDPLLHRRYQQQIWMRSMINITKLFRIGRSALLFWLDRPAAERHFGFEARKKTLRHIIAVHRVLFGTEAPKDLDVRKVWDKGKAAISVLRTEWELLWCEFTRRPYQTQFHTHSLEDTQRSCEYSKVQLFLDSPKWRQRAAEHEKEPLLLPKPSLDKWETLLKDHEAPPPRTTPMNGRDLYRKFQGLVNEAGKEYLGTDVLPQLAEVLYRFTYDHVRRAKIVELCKDKRDDLKVVPCGEKSRRLWVQVIVLSRSAFNLCRSISPHLVDVEYETRIYVSTLYGLALGRLGRFVEAQRRLNEANARLSKLPRRVDEVELAIIELRRAEVHLLEARHLANILQLTIHGIVKMLAKILSKSPASREAALDAWRHQFDTPVSHLIAWLFGKRVHDPEAPDSLAAARRAEQIARQWVSLYELKMVAFKEGFNRHDSYENFAEVARDIITNLDEHLMRLHGARLDDAWVALEHAERLLAGKTRSSQWWGRLCTLRLRTFATHLDPNYMRPFVKDLTRGIRAKNKNEIEALVKLMQQERLTPFRSMAFRRKVDYPDLLISILRVGLAVWPDDPFRRVRLADYFMRAWERHCEGRDRYDCKLLIEEALERCAYKIDTKSRYKLLRDYRNKMIKKARAF